MACTIEYRRGDALHAVETLIGLHVSLAAFPADTSSTFICSALQMMESKANLSTLTSALCKPAFAASNSEGWQGQEQVHERPSPSTQSGRLGVFNGIGERGNERLHKK
jgi:hypothetical protein